MCPRVDLVNKFESIILQMHGTMNRSRTMARYNAYVDEDGDLGQRKTVAINEFSSYFKDI